MQGRIAPGWLPGPDDPPAPGPDVHLWLAEWAAGGPGSEPALRGVLARYLGEEPEAIALDREEGRKPRLAEHPERLRFNLSHSGALLLLAVSGLEVGVDVERVAPRRHALAIAERRLGPAAAAKVRAAGQEVRDVVFTREWARFEARQKCLGLGAFAAAPEAAVAIAEVEVASGYAAAVAARGEGVSVAARYLLG